MAVNVFVSVGRAATTQQARFVAAIRHLLVEAGFAPNTVQRRDLPGSPLPEIERVLATCSGTAVIALERLRAHRAVDLCAPAPASESGAFRLPTIWTQIEAALARSLGHPLLVIAEPGLRREGFLADGHGWEVQSLALDESEIASRPFRRAFGAWRERVLDFHDARAAAAGRRRAPGLDAADLRGLPPSASWKGRAWAR